jgi:hypothetical protein
MKVCGVTPNFSHTAIWLCSGERVCIGVHSKDERQPSPSGRQKSF